MGLTSRECRFLAFDDVLRFRDVNNDDTRARSRARSGESWVAVLVDISSSTTSSTQMGMLKIAYNMVVARAAAAKHCVG